jgi:hypothetical protein
MNLADFGAVPYSDASVTARNGTKGNLSSNNLWQSTNVTMTSPTTTTMATAGPLQGGTSFLSTWVSSG